MGITIGLDVGTVSVKAALLADPASRAVLDSVSGHSALLFRPPWDDRYEKDLYERVLLTEYARIKGSPVAAAEDVLRQVMKVIPEGEIAGVRVCGSGGTLIGQILGVNSE